ncbi:MAG: hypothetical protein AAFO72_14200 [Pseudomonadota bacterium]
MLHTVAWPRGMGPDLDEDYVKRLHAAALRARASGFDGVADAIEEILRREMGDDDVAPPAANEAGPPHSEKPNGD